MTSASASLPSGTAELLGRDDACAEIGSALASAQRGRGTCLLLEGEAGIGKTTLASWTAERAAALGFAVRWGRCDADAATPPLGPWLQLARAHGRGLDAGSGAEAWAAATVGGPSGSEAGDDASIVRHELLDGWRDRWTAAADASPLLLLVEDVHWADVSSLLLLAGLARVAPAHPLVVVATARTGEPAVPRSAAALADARDLASVVPLGGLPRAAVARLVDESGLAGDPELVRVLTERTGANPFFLVELLHVLRMSTGSGPGTTRIAATEVPLRVSDVVRRRVARLPAPVAELLAAAAVLGTEGEVHRLAHVAEVTVDDAMERMERAVDAGLLEEAPSGRWRFAHALVRDAVHDGLPVRRRHELHDRAVVGIEQEGVARSNADLARHAIAALPLGDRDRAIAFCTAAAVDAMAQLAYEEAAEHAARGLEVLGPADELRRLELLIIVGDAQRAAGHLDAARAAFREVADHPGADPQLVARAALGYADPGADLGIAYQASDPATADLLERALAASPEADAPARALLLARLAAELYFSSEPARSRPLAEEAVAMADRLGDPRVRLVARSVHHDAFVVGRAGLDDLLAGSSGLVSLARQAGDRRSRLVAHRARVFDLLAAGDVGAVDAEISAFGRIADEMGSSGYTWWTGLWRAMRALLDGRHDEAEAAAGDATALAGSNFAGLAGTNYGFLLFFLRREQGRLAELEPVLRSFAADQADIPAIAPALALLLAELGRDDEAAGLLSRLVGPPPGRPFQRLRDRNWPVSWFQLARAAYLVGDPGPAVVLREAGRSLTGSCVMVSLATVGLGSADLALAWLADAVGDLDGADEHYRSAEAANARLGAGPWLAQARVDHAHLLWRRNAASDRDDARRLARLAADAAGNLPPVAVRAAALLGTERGGDERADGAVAAPVTGVFRRTASSWELAYGGAHAIVPHAKGLADIAVLLAQPGQPVHALELLGLQATGAVVTGGADEIFDRRAREEIKARLAELDADADEADAAHDGERAARARVERDELIDSLTRAVGLGGRARRLDDPAEKARKTVTARVRNSIRRLDATLPGLATHLDRSVDTGLWCVYRPERPTPWHL